jgi:hypothetical protein
MIGKNSIKLAQQDGHSIETMSRKYAAWTKRAPEADISVIKRAMETSSSPPELNPGGTTLAAAFCQSRASSRRLGQVELEKA